MIIQYLAIRRKYEGTFVSCFLFISHSKFLSMDNVSKELSILWILAKFPKH